MKSRGESGCGPAFRVGWGLSTWSSSPPRSPHPAQGIQQTLNLCQMVPKQGRQVSDSVWAAGERADPHLRIAGVPSKLAGAVIKDLIDSFIGGGQEAGGSLRNLTFGFRDPRKDPFCPHPATRFWPCPHTGGHCEASLVLSHPPGSGIRV